MPSVESKANLYLPAIGRVGSNFQRSYEAGACSIWRRCIAAAGCPLLRVELWNRGIGLRRVNELGRLGVGRVWNLFGDLAFVAEAADHLCEECGQHFLLGERVAVVDFDDDLVAGDFGGDFGGDNDGPAQLFIFYGAFMVGLAEPCFESALG